MKNIKTYEEFEKVVIFNDVADSDVSCDIISLNSKYLTNLYGIEKYKNIITLEIVRNNITSLEGIENLTKLEKIWCYDNEIISLEPLENLINLKYISCSDNKITSLKPISNLTKLEYLYCKTNPIDWVDYIDKQGNTWYIVLPKSIKSLSSDKFEDIEDYWEFIDKNQAIAVSRKFNF